MKAANNNGYHYTECGLDNIWLANGFKIEKTSKGNRVSIKNIEALHDAIGSFLVSKKKNLAGKEFRFLRHELLLSQATLAKFLGVSEQAINRWENDKTEINKGSEMVVRLLYSEQLREKRGEKNRIPVKIRECLKKIADLEEEADQLRDKISFIPSNNNKEWKEEEIRKTA